jgi:hypothetical protein
MKYCDACARAADLFVQLKAVRQVKDVCTEYDILLCSLCHVKPGSLEAAVWTVRARREHAARITQQEGV